MKLLLRAMAPVALALAGSGCWLGGLLGGFMTHTSFLSL